MVRYFRHDGHEFTVVHASDIDFLPPIPNWDPTYNLRSRDLRRAIWVIGRCPELAYMLKRYHAESGFLSGVQVNPRDIAIVRHGDHWVLDGTVVDAWARMERHLLHVSDILLQEVAHRDEYCFPFDAFWPNPSECGYKNDWPNEHSARVAAYRSLDACRVLLARCTMAVALATHDTNQQPPRWAQILLDNNIPPIWVEYFQASLVPNLSHGLRVGAYISPADNDAGTKWVQHIPCMVRANVPVYIYWPRDGRDRILTKYPFLRDYLPMPQSIVDVPSPGAETCFRWPTAFQAPPHCPNLRRIAGCDAPAGEIPHGVGQRPGESAHDFFRRRAQVNALRETMESSEHRYSRLARAQHASSFPRPTLKSPTTVYLWSTVGDHDPTVPSKWLELDYRELIGHARLFEMWELYSQQHKRYDAWHDEWDICPSATPGIKPFQPGVDDLDEEYEECIARTRAPEANTAITNTVHSSLAASFGTDLKMIYDQVPDTAKPMCESLAVVARNAFGLIAQVVDDPAMAYDKYSALDVVKMLGYYVGDVANDAILPKLLSWLIASFEKNPVKPDACGHIWDLAPSSHQYLLNRPHPLMHIEQIALNRSFWYRITYRGEPDHERRWELIVEDGATVLELYRRHELKTRYDAAEFMALRGMRFRTIARLKVPATVHTFNPYYSHWGVRPLGYQFTHDDYRAYEYRLRCTLPTAKWRAALLHGGVVWRIALEMLAEDPKALIHEGPDRLMAHLGKCFRPPRGDDWYDDSLETEDLDLICGVYRLYSGT